MCDSDSDVLVIGAGPSGAVAAALLATKGYFVRILERQAFPRFSIGESLLPHCLDFLSEAGMLDAVHRAGYQYKNGAEFVRGTMMAKFNFGEKSSNGLNYAFQVPRAAFDQLLADQAARAGVKIHYQEEIVAANFSHGSVSLLARNASGEKRSFTARFVLDGSGFGRVLSRLLKLEAPSALPVRHALFTHVEDNIIPRDFDRQKIRITVHPEHVDIWYWLIPFSDGRSSVGVVIPDGLLASDAGPPNDRLRTVLAQDPGLSSLLRNARFDRPVNEIRGYSVNVNRLHGEGYALLGNAAEFLDPVFSSGVTIALRSASAAAAVLDRHLQGQVVDWEQEFARPLLNGVDVFRTFVQGWYDGRFQSVIFSPKTLTASSGDIRAMLCSVLAGYAWDELNPFVRESKRRLDSLVAYCRL